MPKGMIVGYPRTSTAEQQAGLETQERELRVVECEKLFREQVSSVASRAQLAAALDYAREGDTLVVTKPDRLARSTADLLAIIEQLGAKGVAPCVLSMGGQELDTSSSTGKLMLTLLGAVAEFERDLMLERQREGIAKAKADGKYRGRAPTARARTADVLRLRGEGVTPRAIAGQLDISEASVFRILADVRQGRIA